MSHDRKYVVTSSSYSCNFWPTSLIPTLAPGEDEGEGLAPPKKKRRKRQKHRDLTSEELARTKKLQQMDFFSDLCTDTSSIL